MSSLSLKGRKNGKEEDYKWSDCFCVFCGDRKDTTGSLETVLGGGGGGGGGTNKYKYKKSCQMTSDEFSEGVRESLAENLECQLIDTVKKVTVEEIEGNTLTKICESKIYASKLEDKTKQRNYMTTITRQQTYSEEDVQCDAMNQFNLMQTPKKKWAVLIRGLATEILLPVSSKNGVFTKDGLDFALNSLFFATGYAFGDSTFKSLGGEGGVKGKLLYITAVVYIIVVFVAVFALVTLVVLYFMKRNAEIKKRENERSKLLRNPANNTDSDTPVEIVYDNSPENNS